MTTTIDTQRSKSIKLRKELQRINGLYFVYCSKIISYDNYRSNGLLYMQDGEWLAYPHKFGLNIRRNKTINSLSVSVPLIRKTEDK